MILIPEPIGAGFSEVAEPLLDGRPGRAVEELAVSGQPGPELFGDEGHERMKQAKGLIENADRAIQNRALRDLGLVAIEPPLDHLDVPVAEVVPEEIVENLRRLVDLKSFQRGGQFADRRVEAGEEQAVGEVKMIFQKRGMPRTLRSGRGGLCSASGDCPRGRGRSELLLVQ